MGDDRRCTYHVVYRTMKSTLAQGTFGVLDPDGYAPYTTPEGYVRIYKAVTVYQGDAGALAFHLYTIDAASNYVAYLVNAESLTNATWYSFPTNKQALNLAAAWPAIVPSQGIMKGSFTGPAADKTINVSMFYWEIPVDSEGVPIDSLGETLLASAQ
jgi:hypothetical protein